jgi:high frequency lysogenization protein
MASIESITLALAGVFQGANQVIKISETGYDDPVHMRPLVTSLLKLEADTVVDVYGDIAALKPGLEIIQGQLQYGADGKIPQLGRYVASILNLERQLIKQDSMLTVISARITHIKRLTDTADLLDEVIIKAIADLYTDTISNLPLRIQVVGKPQILKQEQIQDKIRCALFCALRSAVLWRQLGGKRRQLLFNRKQLIYSAEELLGQIHKEQSY